MVLRVSRYGGDFAKDEAVSAVVGGTLPVPVVTARGDTHGWAYAVSDRLVRLPRSVRTGGARRLTEVGP